MIFTSSPLVDKLKKISLSDFSLWLILFIPVFVDLANGLLLSKNLHFFSIGILYRSFLFLATFIFIGLIQQKTLLVYSSALTVTFFIVNGFWFVGSDNYSLIHESQFFIKILLPISLLSFLIYLNQTKEIKLNFLIELVVYFGFVASVALIFSFLTGMGMEAYKKSEYSFGIKSYFIAI